MGVILNNLIPIIGSSIAMSIPLILASWPWAWRA